MELNFFTKFLTTPWLRWLFWFLVTILNFYAFVQDPTRFSTLYDYGIPNKWFVYISRMLTFTLDIVTFIGLWLTIPFIDNIPLYWFIPLIIVGFGIISQITVDSDVYSKTKDGAFNPPPNYLWSKNKRVILFAVIMFLNIFIFLQFYIASGVSSAPGNQKTSVINRFVVNRFGGLKSENYIGFLAEWLGLIAFLFDAEMLGVQYKYTPCMYNLPDSWNV